MVRAGTAAALFVTNTCGSVEAKAQGSTLKISHQSAHQTAHLKTHQTKHQVPNQCTHQSPPLVVGRVTALLLLLHLHLQYKINCICHLAMTCGFARLELWWTCTTN